MKEIVISSINKEEKIFTMLAGQNNISSHEVKRQSAAMGETDVLKSIGNLPGISFHNDGSSYFYVRGGNRDQNLVLIDEVPMYNPSHMLGLFSPVIPEAVKMLRFTKPIFLFSMAADFHRCSISAHATGISKSFRAAPISDIFQPVPMLKVL
ncbi:MAG: Plug domain-containing protein [Bacteroidales bacterium]|nr:Plug domain-containing protein [Bacteroidales bacterium]